MKLRNTSIKTILLSALVLGFVFGFDDKQKVFELSVWLLNFLKYALLSFVSLVIFTYAPNLFSHKFACTAKYELLVMRQYGIKSYHKFPKKIPFLGIKISSLPIWLIIPVIISMVSKGYLYFVATMTFVTTINPAYRLGKKFTRLTEYENAKLALISPLTAIILAIISRMLLPQIPELVLINSMLAVSYMLPLPKINGSMIFFGSKILYTLSLIFILLTALLLNFIEPLSATIIAITCALIITIKFIISTYKS